MIKAFFITTLYQPLYNAFVFLMDILPWADAGVIIILFTLIVRFALFPLSQKAIISQIQMRKIQPDIEKVREKHKNDKQEQARAIMALYKEKNINPFSGFLALLIQLPIIFSLYHIFVGGLSQVDTSLLYSFIATPEQLKMVFLGLIDLGQKSMILAALAGITQYIQAHIMAVHMAPQTNEQSFANDLAKSMTFQTKYVIPVFILVISYFAPAAIALYWVVSNVFTIVQELYVRRKYAALK